MSTIIATELVGDVVAMNGEVANPLPFIVSALNLLSRMPCITANYDMATQKEIAKLLALHLASAAGKSTVIEEKIGEATTKYAAPQKFGEGLNSTQWGRNVLMLDTAGCLAALGKKRIRLTALGPVPRGSTVDTAITDPDAVGVYAGELE